MVSGDTVTNTVVYSNDPAQVGRSFRWTVEGVSADTLSFTTMDLDGRVTGHGRSVRIR